MCKSLNNFKRLRIIEVILKDLKNLENSFKFLSEKGRTSKFYLKKRF